MTSFRETPRNILTYLLSFKMVNAHVWLLVHEGVREIKISGNILLSTPRYKMRRDSSFATFKALKDGIYFSLNVIYY